MELSFPTHISRRQSLFEIVWRLTLDAFITTWVAIVVISLLACLFIRFTASSPGIYPSHGLKGRSPYLPNEHDEHHPETLELDHHGTIHERASWRAFPSVGASECDVMFNLVPEVATADARGVLV